MSNRHAPFCSQCALVIPEVFEVQLPPETTSWLSWLRFLSEGEVTATFMPPQCIGSYQARLTVSCLAPLLLMLAVLLFYAARHSIVAWHTMLQQWWSSGCGNRLLPSTSDMDTALKLTADGAHV
jgi:hypothetical protein